MTSIIPLNFLEPHELMMHAIPYLENTEPSPATTTSTSGVSRKEVVTSFLCGCLGGIANILSSHPLDTVKVRMQLQDMKMKDCFSYMIKEEGYRSLYKGIASPLFNVPLIYAVFFGTYEFAKYEEGVTPGNETITQCTIAGGAAGIGVSLVQTPVELVKCRLQMSGAGIKGSSISAMAMTRKILKAHGWQGLYRGNLITMLREVPASAIYFGSYEYAKRILHQNYGETQFVPLVAGGLAGLLSWMISYPQDVIKSKIQCDTNYIRRYPHNRYIKDGGIISCAREIYNFKGLTGFTRGFSACALRAVISEAATFSVFENTKDLAEKYIDL